jgi:hypothetical protein
MKEAGVATELIAAAALRLVDATGLTDADVGVLLGKSGVAAPFSAIMAVRKQLRGGEVRMHYASLLKCGLPSIAQLEISVPGPDRHKARLSQCPLQLSAPVQPMQPLELPWGSPSVRGPLLMPVTVLPLQSPETLRDSPRTREPQANMRQALLGQL